MNRLPNDVVHILEKYLSSHNKNYYAFLSFSEAPKARVVAAFYSMTLIQNYMKTREWLQNYDGADASNI